MKYIVDAEGNKISKGYHEITNKDGVLIGQVGRGAPERIDIKDDSESEPTGPRTYLLDG